MEKFLMGLEKYGEILVGIRIMEKFLVQLEKYGEILVDFLRKFLMDIQLR
jgi:hypothetical protein